MFLLLFALILSSFVMHTAPYDGAEFDTSVQCAAEAETNILTEDMRLFFTMPSQADELMLDLWYLDSSGTTQTPLKFAQEDLLVISPDGKHIFVGRTKSNFVMGRGAFDFGGSNFLDIFVVDLSTFTTRKIETPKWFYQLRFVKNALWIDNSTLIFVSIWGEVLTVRLNVDTQEFLVQEWKLEDLSLPYPTGRVIPSPDGKYLFYTTDVVSLTGPNLPYFEQSWRVIDTNNKIVIDYVMGTVGDSAVWLPDSSGVLLNDLLSNDVVQVDLTGNVTILYEHDQVYLSSYGLPDRSKSQIAFEGSTGEVPDFNTLSILDKGNHQLTNYCLLALRVEPSYWSNDGQFLAYIIHNSSSTQLNILDVRQNMNMAFIPYQPRDDITSSLFVRILGWQTLQ